MHNKASRPYRMKQYRVIPGSYSDFNFFGEYEWREPVRTYASLDGAVRVAIRDYEEDGWLADVEIRGEEVWSVIEWRKARQRAADARGSEETL